MNGFFSYVSGEWCRRVECALVFVIVLAVGTASADSNKNKTMLWDDRVRSSIVATDSAEGIAVTGDRVYVAGSVSRAESGSDFTVRAYDGRTGELVWEDRVDDSTGDGASAVVALDNRVYAAGSLGFDLENLTGGDLVVRAYDATTGKLVWEDRHDGQAGATDIASAIAIEGDRIYVAGVIDWDIAEHTGGDFVLRALDRRTGELLWEDRFGGEGDSLDFAKSVTADGGRVYTAGLVAQAGGIHSFRVRAHDGAAGKLLWEDEFRGEAAAIVARDDRVYAAGYATNLVSSRDFTVRAYDGRTGDLSWEDRFDGSISGSDEAFAIAAGAEGIYAAGAVANSGADDFTVRAYHPATGALQWSDEVDGQARTIDQALAVATLGQQVYVAGVITNSGTFRDFAVRAYDVRTGRLLWSDELDAGQIGDEAFEVAVQSDRVYAAGRAATDSGTQFVVRAYTAKNSASDRSRSPAAATPSPIDRAP